MGRIAEARNLLKTAAKVLFFGEEIEDAPEQLPAADILQRRLDDAMAVLETMRTRGWKVYEQAILDEKARRVEELLAHSVVTAGVPAMSSDAVLREKKDRIRGMQDALEAAYAIVTAGELAEAQIEQLGVADGKRQQPPGSRVV